MWVVRHLGKMRDPAARTTVPWPSWNTCSSKSMPEGVKCTLRPITFSILHHKHTMLIKINA